jgi:4-amino-4-deoxy-L-arabinose transferase-like glycosyltransferase
MFSKKKLLKKIISKYQKREKLLNTLVILSIFCLGFYIRLYLYPTNSVWVGDAARDMLIGHLITFKNMSSRYGPWNTGISSTYPPIYYYFIATLTAIAKGNHNSLAGLIIFYQSIGIILTFLIIKKEFSKVIALAASLFYALSSAFIYLSMLQISVSNSVIIVLISLLFLQSAFKKDKIIHLVISAVLLSLASSFWYGAMFIWPIYLLIYLLNFDSQKSEVGNLLGLIVFGLSAILSFFIFFSPVIEVVTLSNIRQQLFGNGINQLSLSNFKIDNFLKSIELTINILHPKLTTFMYFIYGLIILAGLSSKNKHFKKLTLIALFALLFHYIFYNIHESPLGHYLNNVYFFLAALLIYALRIVLEKNTLAFLSLFLIILISSKSFEQEKLDSDISYQHYSQVSNQIHQSFPDSSIIDGGEFCQNTTNHDYWNSRVFWYFQKEKPYFIFDDVFTQVDLTNTNTVLLCWQNLNSNQIDSDYLNREDDLLKFQLQGIEYKIFEN